MRAFSRFETFTTGLAMSAAIVFLIIAGSLAFFQVVTRFVFDAPSTWSEVLTRSAMIWSVFLGAAPAFRHGSMIAMEMIQRLLPGLWGKALFVFANLLSILFFAILFWQGIAMTGRVLSQTLAGVGISIAWVYAALPVGSVFAIIAILAFTLRQARPSEEGAEAAEERGIS
jgi:TRAP-type C4-dicarboxylate transport system permease small subunit